MLQLSLFFKVLVLPFLKRCDLPRYCIFSKGRLVQDALDLQGFAWDDMVTFYTGCSFSFESALQEARLEVRNLTKGKEVSVYQSDIRLHPVGVFSGLAMMVTMRPFPRDSIHRVVAVTARIPDAHGAPIHIGDPSRIGVELSHLKGGEAVEIKEGEVPVFWACGITNREAITTASKMCVFWLIVYTGVYTMYVYVHVHIISVVTFESLYTQEYMYNYTYNYIFMMNQATLRHNGSKMCLLVHTYTCTYQAPLKVSVLLCLNIDVPLYPLPHF